MAVNPRQLGTRGPVVGRYRRPMVSAPRSGAVRWAIIAAYTVVFWGLLPLAVGLAGDRVDRALGWSRMPSAWGAPFALGGVLLMGWAMVALWRHAGGLPVSALPPPRLTWAGPYRHLRHPIYAGFNLAVLGAGLLVGSRGTWLVVAPVLMPLWVAYALVEERGLVGRFGRDYRRYRAQVGLFPRWKVYGLSRCLVALGVIRVKVIGRERIPRRGAAILVANHAWYLDPAALAAVCWRPLHYWSTAEAFRTAPLRWLVTRGYNVPLRRYWPDVAACRELVRVLEDGELVGMFPEGERAPLGNYQGADEVVAGIVARLGVPVIPVALDGSYDCGPRWADVLRRRPVTARVGEPIVFDGHPPKERIDAALRALLGREAQAVQLEGLALEKLERVLWRCPRCGDEPGWSPSTLACAACGARWTAAELTSVAELGRAVRRFLDAGPLRAPARGFHEGRVTGFPQPLEPLGSGELVLDAAALRFGPLELGWRQVRSVSTERADTLQVATSGEMWQFRVDRGSVFRLQLAAERWRAQAGPAEPRRRRPGR